jgi:hypothetical protein
MSGISKEDKYTMGMGMGMDEEERGIREPESKNNAAPMTEGEGIHENHTS